MLERIPDQLGELGNLQRLSFERIHASSLPETLWGLSNLVELKLMDCRELRGISPSIGRLSKLQLLEISSCRKLLELPMELCRLKNLESLKLDNLGSLETRLPTKLLTLPKLKSLYLSSGYDGNMVISFPDDPSDLPDFVSLKRLALSGMDIHYMLNDEERRIRSYLKKCPNLEELDLIDSNWLIS